MGSNSRLCDLFKQALAFASGTADAASALRFDLSGDPASLTVTAMGEAIGEALGSVRASRPISVGVIRELRARTGLILPKGIDQALGRTLEVLEGAPDAATLTNLARDIEAALEID